MESCLSGITLVRHLSAELSDRFFDVFKVNEIIISHQSCISLAVFFTEVNIAATDSAVYTPLILCLLYCFVLKTGVDLIIIMCCIQLSESLRNWQSAMRLWLC